MHRQSHVLYMTTIFCSVYQITENYCYLYKNHKRHYEMISVYLKIDFQLSDDLTNLSSEESFFKLNYASIMCNVNIKWGT